MQDRMPRKLIAASFALALSVASPTHAQSASNVTISCGNPDPAARIVGGAPAGNAIWRVTSSAIQFNINRPADPGTVFVNAQNDGVCTVTVPGRYEIINGWGEIGSHHPPDIASSIVVDPRIRDNNTVAFHVRAVGQGVGNADVTFFVRYRRAR